MQSQFISNSRIETDQILKVSIKTTGVSFYSGKNGQQIPGIGSVLLSHEEAEKILSAALFALKAIKK